jgi:ADP-ribose pyrophosphatase
MTPVFGFVEDFASFGKHARRQRNGAVDRTLFGQEVDFVPLFPRLERLAVDLRRKAYAVALFDVEPNDEHLGPAWEIGPVFPERAVRRVVVLPDFYRFDVPCLQIGSRAQSRIIPRSGVVFPSGMDEQHGTGWRVLSSSYPIATPFLRLRSDVIELPDGTIIENYYVRETLGFTIVFALTTDQRVVLVRQYKHGAARTVLELPAGAIDEGENAAECAARELAEETGYVGDEPQLVRTYLADPTNSNGSFHLFMVRNAELRAAQSFDLTEDIAVEIVTLTELRAMLRDGRIDTGSHVASIYATLDYLALL